MPMTPMEQCIEWANGNSVHNPDRDECCPDFSCCYPEGLWDKSAREAFLKQYREKGAEGVEHLLSFSLSNLVSNENTYIAGTLPENETKH